MGLAKSAFDPLRRGGRLDLPLFGVFLGISAIVLVNAVLHDPMTGYDATQHVKYVMTLAEGELPTRSDTGEFFSPPLPYVLPALLHSRFLDLKNAMKVGQIQNVLLSLGIGLLLLRIDEDLSPENRAMKLGSLLLLGLLTVYFKTLSFVRGEPFVAFFTLLSLCISMRAILLGQRHLGPWLGISLGLLLLSRQWGVFVVAALLIFAGLIYLRDPERREGVLRTILPSLVVCALLSLPFYLSLYRTVGNPAAFNRKRTARFALSNQDLNFYFGLGVDKVFTDPVRPAFFNQLLPVFYSETWGDYWEFFLIYARDRHTGEFLARRELEKATVDPSADVETNRWRMGPYLGRVNRVSILPTLALLGGLGFGLRGVARFCREKPPSPANGGFTLLTLTILLSAIGYLGFLVAFPEPERGDTIKATYVLQVFPLLAILAGAWLSWLSHNRPRLSIILVIAWGAVFLHNLPALITRHF